MEDEEKLSKMEEELSTSLDDFITNTLISISKREFGDKVNGDTLQKIVLVGVSALSGCLKRHVMQASCMAGSARPGIETYKMLLKDFEDEVNSEKFKEFTELSEAALEAARVVKH